MILLPQQEPARQVAASGFPEAGTETRLDSFEPEKFRKKIGSKEYLDEAIQRIALVLSNEFLNISQKGLYHYEWKRRK
jgi:hypothetical protein